MTMASRSKVISFAEALNRRRSVIGQMLGPKPYQWKQPQAGRWCYLVCLSDQVLIESHITPEIYIDGCERYQAEGISMPDVLRELDIIASLVSKETSVYSDRLKLQLASWLAMYLAIGCSEFKTRISLQQHALIRVDKAPVDKRFHAVTLTQGKSYTAESLVRRIQPKVGLGTIKRIYR
jgi:hypothetical protein